MTASTRTFEKCLKTMLRTGPKEEDYHCFILPYSGNVTEPKLKAMAGKFAELIKPYYGDSPEGHVEKQLFMRLKSEWYTGREKNVVLSQLESGNWRCEGEGWFASNYPDGHFVVIE